MGPCTPIAKFVVTTAFKYIEPKHEFLSIPYPGATLYPAGGGLRDNRTV